MSNTLQISNPMNSLAEGAHRGQIYNEQTPSIRALMSNTFEVDTPTLSASAARGILLLYHIVNHTIQYYTIQ